MTRALCLLWAMALPLHRNNTVGPKIDPQYKDPTVYGSSSTAADYTLSATSPCAGAGTTITSATVLLNR